MSTTPKFPTHAEQLLTALAVFSEHPKGPLCTFDLDADDCLALVGHFRTQANTLASTQAELELCRATVTEQAKDSADNYAECERLSAELTASESAHLATRRALHFAATWAKMPNFPPPDGYFEAVTAARAEVAKADACKKNDPVFLTVTKPARTCADCAILNGDYHCSINRINFDSAKAASELSACFSFQPRADAQKGGAM